VVFICSCFACWQSKESSANLLRFNGDLAHRFLLGTEVVVENRPGSDPPNQTSCNETTVDRMSLWLHKPQGNATLAMIEFRNQWLRKHINQKFGRGALQAIIQAWPIHPSPSRQELWRWLNGEVPRIPIPSTKILPLAGALDIDPFALFETTPRAYATLCTALMQDVASGKSGQLVRSLQWAHDLIVPNLDWPPSSITKMYFGGRRWKIRDFSHAATGERNYFQRFRIVGDRDLEDPQVWHFAFLNVNAKRPLWTPYGFVVKESGRIRLYQSRGHTDEVEGLIETKSFAVETWFGMGPAEFRVASLHPFTLSLVQGNDRTERCVTFP